MFNVTGFLTADAKANSTLTLLIAPNTTLAGALYAAEHCSALIHVPVTGTGTFTLPSLPEGDYVLSAPRTAFFEGQGFPIIDEYNTSTHSVEQAWHGGNQHHSLGRITIHPLNKSEPTLEYSE